jgi:iron complex outermembrane receptor protein
MIRISISSSVSGIVIATCAIVCASAGFAQSIAAAHASRVDEIVVIGKQWITNRNATATKSDSSLIEVPQSISIVTREQLDARSVQNIMEAISYSSGVVGGSTGSDTRRDTMTLRGFTPAPYLDGLQLPGGAYISFRPEPYGLEQVEILKGPSSGLYGQSPPGGLINMVSRKPVFDPVNELLVQSGSFKRKQVGFDFGGPVFGSNKLAFRLTGMERDADTQIDFVEDQREFIAPSVTFRANENTTLTVLSQYLHDSVGTGIQWLPLQGTLLPNPNGKIPPNRFTGEPDYDTYARDQYSIGYQLDHVIAGSVHLRQNVRYAEVDLTYRASYATGFEPGSLTMATRGTTFVTENPATFNVDTYADTTFNTGGIRHQVLIGVDYRRTASAYQRGLGSIPSFNIFDPVYGAGAAIIDPPITIHNDQTQKQTGIYLQDQANLDQWVVTLTGRHDWADTRTSNILTNAEAGQKDDAFTGRAGVNYVFESGFAPYLSYAQSFEPALGTNRNNDAFRPTTARQYEAGIKYQALDSASTASVAVYDLVQHNVVTPDPIDPLFKVQTGAVRARGIELDGAMVFSPSLTLQGSYTYADTEVTSTNVASQLGKQLLYVPKYQAAARAYYSLNVGTEAEVSLNAGVRYTGASYGDPENQQQSPAYTLMDAGAHYAWKNWRLSLNVNNLFDKEHITTCRTNVASANRSGCYYGYRRTITATLGYNW